MQVWGSSEQSSGHNSWFRGETNLKKKKKTHISSVEFAFFTQS